MNEEKLGDILLSVDLGFDLNKVAEGYVQAFNKSGAHMIVSYDIREPTEQEVANARKLFEKIKQIDGQWVLERKMFDNTIIRKRVFVLVPKKTMKTPEHIMKLRPKVKAGNIEVTGETNVK